MGVFAWIILFAVSGLLATAAQYLVFGQDRKMTDTDWGFIAGGALLGGFAATMSYHVGPLVDGLYLLPALAGEVMIGTVAEIIYSTFIRPRQTE